MDRKSIMKEDKFLPSTWHLAWMLFMQPRLLIKKSVDLGFNISSPGWRLWQTNQLQSQFLLRLTGAILIVSAIGQITALIAANAINAPIDIKEIMANQIYALLLAAIFSLFISYKEFVGLYIVFSAINYY